MGLKFHQKPNRYNIETYKEGLSKLTTELLNNEIQMLRAHVTLSDRNGNEVFHNHFKKRLAVAEDEAEKRFIEGRL